MNPTVLCVGRVNLDCKLKLSEPLQMGTSNPVSSLISPGGVAQNVAENLARLKCKVFLLSIFSNDVKGKWLLGQLEELGIDCSLSQKVPGRISGSYTSVQNSEGEMLLAMADMQLANMMTFNHMEKYGSLFLIQMPFSWIPTFLSLW